MRGFTDDERERIRERLVETGRDLLLRYGPRKTNVADVTEPVGIAKSSFYLFFDSKADLYLEVMHRETDAFLSTIEDELADVDDPVDGLERLFRCYRAFAEENPLVQQILAQDNYRETFQSAVSPQRLEEVQQEGLAAVVPFIESIQEMGGGSLAEHDPTTILGVMGTIGVTVLHRAEFEEYDEDYYDRVMELLITSLAKGLAAESK